MSNNRADAVDRLLRVNSDKVQNVGQSHWAEYEGNLFFQVLAFFGPYLK